MRLAAVGAAVLLAACPSTPTATQTPTAGSGPVGPVPTPTVDAPGPSQDEKLAAIQKAMNELDEAVQACWAVAATKRYEIAGDLVAQIEIAAQPTPARTATTTLVQDTARVPELAACVVDVMNRYPWAPPLRGDTIQLPFRVRAPSDGQNVIDRRLVTANGQGDIRISVLLDDNNSGNAQASLLEVAIAAGKRTGMRRADRAELWYFLGPATIESSAKPIAVVAGDAVLVPAQAVRDIVATSGALTAVLVLSPGGAEGTARAGALPTPETPAKGAPAPQKLAAADAKSYPRGQGKVTILVDPSIVKASPFAVSILELPAGMGIPEHVHDKETELLYVTAGGGTMTVKGTALAVSATSVVQVPPATPHAFVTVEALRAIQIYVPGGPEQRFKAK